jgi:hypothetical protein
LSRTDFARLLTLTFNSDKICTPTELLLRRGNFIQLSATAAAAGEKKDDKKDPDPVIVIENTAKTVVHRRTSEKYEIEKGTPSNIILCRIR